MVIAAHLQATARAVRLLDLIPTYDTHKIGIVYVDKDQVGVVKDQVGVV